MPLGRTFLRWFALLQRTLTVQVEAAGRLRLHRQFGRSSQFPAVYPCFNVRQFQARLVRCPLELSRIDCQSSEFQVGEFTLSGGVHAERTQCALDSALDRDLA